MKKLLQINTVSVVGSTGHIAEEIGKLAMNNGWESYIASKNNDYQSSSTLIRIGKDIDRMIHSRFSTHFDKQGLGSGFATKSFIKKIQSINPDIIHLHNLHGNFINYKVLFGFLNNSSIPVVWTFHDCWPFTGHCVHFEYVNCKKWIGGCSHCPQTHIYPKSYIIDNSKNNYELKKSLFTEHKNLTIVSLSLWMKNLLEQSFLQNHRIKIINNGINLKDFYPRPNTNEIRIKHKIENKFIVLGVSGVWSLRKGFDDFIKLSAIIDSDTIIILIGLTDEQIRILPENIIGLRRTESVEELAKYYSMANVYFSASYEESFGTTILEALACGTMPIVYNITSNSELITKDTGFIVNRGNIVDVNLILKKIMNNNIIKEINTDCVKRAELLFNQEVQFSKYLKLYDEVLR